MKLFFARLADDFRTYQWIDVFVVLIVVFLNYGVRLIAPVAVYDFAAAKGDAFQVFLTYFFMHRWSQGVIAAFFHDFTPLWNASVGMAFFTLFLLMLGIIAKRLTVSRWRRLLFVALWACSPFFYNRSIYQHALPAETIALCLDALVLLLFMELQHLFVLKKFWLCIGAATVATSVYQAHVNLLLTAMLGIVLLQNKMSWAAFRKDLTLIALLLFTSVGAYVLMNYGPLAVAKLVGIIIPPSGGAHDAIYWFSGEHTFVENLMGLLSGIVLNWGYNALFVVGLRVMWLALIVLLFYTLLALIRNRQCISALYAVTFALSVFAFPVLQCATANIRTFYCFMPLTAFTGLFLLRLAHKPRSKRLAACIVVFICFTLAHETATLHYYWWKTKALDTLHMGNVALDLGHRYGARPNKPVAVIGGKDSYGTTWDAMRPNRNFPLLRNPFSTYSNLTSHNVPREFYMLARENVGLVVQLPSWNTYESIRKDAALIQRHPAYPQEGYIFEKDDIIIVNFGDSSSAWPVFDFADYRSPNEVLLFKTFHLNQLMHQLGHLIAPLRALAERYPWALTR